jgi:hypothetical protein
LAVEETGSQAAVFRSSSAADRVWRLLRAADQRAARSTSTPACRRAAEIEKRIHEIAWIGKVGEPVHGEHVPARVRRRGRTVRVSNALTASVDADSGGAAFDSRGDRVALPRWLGEDVEISISRPLAERLGMRLGNHRGRFRVRIPLWGPAFALPGRSAPSRRPGVGEPQARLRAPVGASREPRYPRCLTEPAPPPACPVQCADATRHEEPPKTTLETWPGRRADRG